MLWMGQKAISLHPKGPRRPPGGLINKGTSLASSFIRLSRAFFAAGASSDSFALPCKITAPSRLPQARTKGFPSKIDRFPNKIFCRIFVVSLHLLFYSERLKKIVIARSGATRQSQEIAFTSFAMTSPSMAHYLSRPL